MSDPAVRVEGCLDVPPDRSPGAARHFDIIYGADA